MAEPRRLRGNKAAATCCIASRLRPGLVATAAEDGSICWYDLRCKDMLFSMNVGNGTSISSLSFKPGNEDIIYVSAGYEVKIFDLNMTASWKLLESYNYNKDEINQDGSICWYDLRCKDMLFSMNVGNGTSISSLCFKPGNEDIIYVSAGYEVKIFDLNMTASWKLLESYNYNKDEINQIACHSKSSFLAAADDTGDVKIIDIHQRCLYKTLRAGHNTICSSVQFLPWRSWEVITGGLDSKLVMWDFSKGRPNKIIDFGSGGDGGQCYNPAFIHALVVPELDMVDKFGKICAVARGDGVVNIINIESELTSIKSRNSGKSKSGSIKSTSKSAISSSYSQSEDQIDKNLHLDYTKGGHVAAVSSVTFSLFGEKGKFIVSGGNDKSVKVWDWSKSFNPGRTSNSNDLLSLNISLSRKVNWLCTTPSDSENLVVCDTSKVVKVYTIG